MFQRTVSKIEQSSSKALNMSILFIHKFYSKVFSDWQMAQHVKAHVPKLDAVISIPGT